MDMTEWQPRTDGPLGPPCQLPRPPGHRIHCYKSCGHCSEEHSCDWTACYDDMTFIREIVKYVGRKYCLDTDSVHLTGNSNGGMFSEVTIY